MSCGFGFRSYSFFHTDGVDHQFKVFKDFRLLAVNECFDGFIAQQLGKVAFGQHQFPRIRGGWRNWLRPREEREGPALRRWLPCRPRLAIGPPKALTYR